MKKQNLVKPTILIVAIMGMSRILGFIRDTLMMRFFGASLALDAFLVAIKIPAFMRTLFEDSFPQAFVPILAEYQKSLDHRTVNQFINVIIGTLGFLLFIVMILGEVFSPILVKLFAPGMEYQRYTLTVVLLRMTFPYLFLTSFVYISGAILNTYNKYWIAAFTPILMNVLMIASILWLAPHLHQPIFALAIGMLISGFLQIWLQLPFLKKIFCEFKITINFNHPGIKKVFKQMVPAILNVSVAQVNFLSDTFFASFLMIGSISWIYLSERIFDLPLSLFGAAITTVMLPNLSRDHITQSNRNFSLIMDWSLRCILLIALPASIILFIMSGPLLISLFQYGKFDSHAVYMTQQCLSIFGLGVVPMMLVKVLSTGFYAKQDMFTPVQVGIICVTFNIIFNIIFLSSFAHVGIAISTSLAAFINMFLLLCILLKRNIFKPSKGWVIFLLRLISGNLILGIWLCYAIGDSNSWVIHGGVWRMSHLFLILSAGMMIYFVSIWLTGMKLHHFQIRKDMSLLTVES